METLIKEINDLLERKNERISVLEWENGKLKKENEELSRNLVDLSVKNAELRADIEKYKENEENRI